MAALAPAATHDELTALIAAVGEVHVSDAVRRLAVALTTATRTSDELRLGASPRGTLHLVRASRAWAALDGRTFVLPDDILMLAPTVLGHRVLVSAQTAAAGRTGADAIRAIVTRIPRSSWS